MCRILKVSRSGYYYWIKYPNSKRTKRKAAIDKQIKDAYFKNKGLYGSPRLAVDITSKGTKISRTTVALHMKQMNLQSKVRRKHKITTNSDHKEPICENILNREFNPMGPSLKWVSDITYIHTLEGFLYLTTVIDLFDRKVIGWSISDGMSADETVIAALNMAVKKRKPAEDMIFHSDRGVQYASLKTRNIIYSHNMRQSMSRKGNCWDNAVAESFFKTLKTELIYGYKQTNKELMRLKLFQYIEIWYNRKRRHSFLNNMNIQEFWEQYNLKNNNYSNVA